MTTVVILTGLTALAVLYALAWAVAGEPRRKKKRRKSR